MQFKFAELYFLSFQSVRTNHLTTINFTADVLANGGLMPCLICYVLKERRSISVMCSSNVAEYGTFLTNAFALPQRSFWCRHLCRRKGYFFFSVSFVWLRPMFTTPITSFARLTAGHTLAFKHTLMRNCVLTVTNAWVIVWRSFQQHVGAYI